MKRVQVISDNNSLVFEIFDDDGNSAGWVTEFKVAVDGTIAPESGAGAELREQRESAVEAVRADVLAAMAADAADDAPVT